MPSVDNLIEIHTTYNLDDMTVSSITIVVISNSWPSCPREAASSNPGTAFFSHDDIWPSYQYITTDMSPCLTPELVYEKCELTPEKIGAWSRVPERS